MQVILLERVEKLGQMGDVVEVKPGFARNYLLPQGKALRATDDNKKRFESRRSQIEATSLTRRTEAEGVATKLRGMVLPLIRQASEGDQLYGSVSTRDIHQALTDAGITVERRQVLLERTIKTVGLHKLRVALHPEVIVDITANVARSEGELEIQARGERPSDVAARAEAETEAALAAEEVFEAGAAPAELAAEKPAPAPAAATAHADDDDEDEAEKPSQRTRPRRR